MDVTDPTRFVGGLTALTIMGWWIRHLIGEVKIYKSDLKEARKSNSELAERILEVATASRIYLEKNEALSSFFKENQEKFQCQHPDRHEK